MRLSLAYSRRSRRRTLRLEPEDLTLQVLQVQHAHGVVAAELARALTGIEDEDAIAGFEGESVIVAVQRDVASARREHAEIAGIVHHDDSPARPFEQEGAVEVEYVELVDSETLRSIATIRGKVLLAVAGRVGRTRLIDNLVLSVTPEGEVAEDSLF